MIGTLIDYVKSQPIRSVIILIFIILLIATSYYIYIRYSGVPQSTKQYIPNDEYDLSKGDDNNTAELIMFYTTWCPYCKKAKPVWEQITQEFNEQYVNNVKVICKDIDRDEYKEMAEEYNVKGVPTIILIKPNGEQVLYDAKPSYEHLVEFLNTSL